MGIMFFYYIVDIQRRLLSRFCLLFVAEAPEIIKNNLNLI